eukprot:TRINITY_DN12336_c0_g1_i3.p1 TRINITY_DN12336_c0_g1~~TRINITY_DN12336_c0_g1_i3.p1  ORF type:complete len:521 (+),score=167.22 TRINITY_DN12336_c0_g1_i3:217-1779(+)
MQQQAMEPQGHVRIQTGSQAHPPLLNPQLIHQQQQQHQLQHQHLQHQQLQQKQLQTQVLQPPLHPPLQQPQLQAHLPPQLQPSQLQQPGSPHSPSTSGYSSPTNSLGSPRHRQKTFAKKPAVAPPPPEDAADDINDEDIANMPPSVKRPCVHNEWDDVRTRKGSKILRCRTCQRKWKLPSSHVPRCLPFLRGHCGNESCHLLHVHKKKSGLMERYEQFGEAVLRAMPPMAKAAAEDAVAAKERLDRVRRSSMGSEHPSLLSDDMAQHHRRASVATSISEPPSLITERRASVAFSNENSIHDRRASLFSDLDYNRRASIISETGGLMGYDPTRRCSTVSELDGARRAAILSDLEAIRKGPGLFGETGVHEGVMTAQHIVARRRIPMTVNNLEAQAMESYRLGVQEPVEEVDRRMQATPSPTPDKGDTDSLGCSELYQGSRKGSLGFADLSPPESRKSSLVDSRRSSAAGPGAGTSPTTSPIPSPTAGEPVPKKKGRDNEGVHAMSEAELDEHMKRHFGSGK